jgi:hypothetical protein
MKRRYKILGAIGGVLVVSVAVLAIAISHDSPCGTAPELSADKPSMKAIVYRCYGGPEVLKLESIASDQRNSAVLKRSTK